MAALVNSAISIMLMGTISEKDIAIVYTNTKQERNTNSIRVLLQSCSATPASSVKSSKSLSGVSKAQGYQALLELYEQTNKVSPGLVKVRNFR